MNEQEERREGLRSMWGVRLFTRTSMALKVSGQAMGSMAMLMEKEKEIRRCVRADGRGRRLGLADRKREISG